MRGVDEETGEYLSPSRSMERREALAVLALAEELAGMSAAQLDRIPLEESLREAIDDARRITSHIARKRGVQTLAKRLRREDEDVLLAIRKVLGHDKAEARREAGLLHQVEAWREKLVAGGDPALAALINEHPALAPERQHLRQLARNAVDERARNKPPRAFRELFRELKALHALDADAAHAADASDAADDAADLDDDAHA